MNFSEEEINEFLTEANELLDSAEKSLLAMDNGDTLNNHYDSIFRAFHSIKGASGMMEMGQLQSHMHQLENLFTEQKGKSTLEKPWIDFFLKGNDAARTLLEGKAIQFDYTAPKTNGAATSAPTAEAKTVPVSNTLVNSSSKTASIGKVIVVDDEPDLVEIITTILNIAGLEVFSTTNPKAVMDMIATHRPDSVLSDISMPGMSGKDLLAQIAAKYPDIPVIFISGNVTKDVLIDAIACGVHAVIEKPFDSGKVVQSALAAVKKYKLSQLLNSSINLLLYQFSDLDEFLKAQGKEDVRKTLRTGINNILEQRQQLRIANKKS